MAFIRGPQHPEPTGRAHFEDRSEKKQATRRGKGQSFQAHPTYRRGTQMEVKEAYYGGYMGNAAQSLPRGGEHYKETGGIHHGRKKHG